VRTAAAFALGLLAACGDDPKEGAPPVGPGAPPGPSAPAVPSPETPAPPAGRATVALRGWAEARVGDYATWEVRVPGTDGTTTLTWRVTAVEGSAVRYAVRSQTTGAGGKALGAANAEETHEAVPAIVAADAVEENVTVAGRSIRAWKSVAVASESSTTVWTSPEVPLSGVVKSIGPGGAEQTLVAWARGR
jgi:hypothetical protein